MKYGKPAFILTVIVFAGFIGLYFKRNHIYSIDFTGGDEITVKYHKKTPSDIYPMQNIIGELAQLLSTDITGTNNW
jgi:preprotein translocase subunit SecF